MPVLRGRTGRKEIRKKMLGQKAIDCLRIAEALPTSSAERKRRAEAAVARWSEKAVDCKLEELAGRGYIEYGTNVWGGWLTTKGRIELARHKGG